MAVISALGKLVKAVKAGKQLTEQQERVARRFTAEDFAREIEAGNVEPGDAQILFQAIRTEEDTDALKNVPADTTATDRVEFGTDAESVDDVIDDLVEERVSPDNVRNFIENTAEREPFTGEDELIAGTGLPPADAMIELANRERAERGLAPLDELGGEDVRETFSDTRSNRLRDARELSDEEREADARVQEEGVRTQLPAQEFFRDDLVKRAQEGSRFGDQDPQSRQIVVEMSPREFLKYARAGERPESTERVAKMEAEGEQFETPELWVDDSLQSGHFFITGHEGRHRARQLIEKGIERMPVILHRKQGRGPLPDDEELKIVPESVTQMVVGDLGRLPKTAPSVADLKVVPTDFTNVTTINPGLGGTRGRGPRNLVVAGAAAGAGGAAFTEEAEAEEAEFSASIEDESRTGPSDAEVFEETSRVERLESRTGEIPQRLAKDVAVNEATVKAIREGRNLMETYRDAVDRLRNRTGGESSVRDADLEHIAEDETVRTRAELVRRISQDENLTRDQRGDLLQATIDLQGEGDLMASREQAVGELASVDDSETNVGAEIQDRRIPNLEERLALEEIQHQAANNLLKTNAKTSELLAEFSEIVLPFVEQSNFMQIAEDAGFDTSVLDFVFFGSARRRIAEEISVLPPAQRAEAISKLVDAAKEHDGLFMDENELMQFIQTDAILKEGGPTDADVIVDNVIGLLDILGATTVMNALGRAAGRVSKLGKRGDDINIPEPTPIPEDEPPRALGLPNPEDAYGVRPGSPQSMYNIANPSAARRSATAGIVDETGETADAMGTTQFDLLFSHAWPKPFNYDLQGAPQILVDVLERFNEIETEAFRATDSLGIALTSAEKAAIRTREWENLDSVSGLSAHVPLSKMRYTDEGLELSGTYGPNAEHGYGSIRQAAEAAEYKFGFKDDPDTQILFHNFADDSFGVVPKETVESVLARGDTGATSGGEFFIQRNQRRSYNSFTGNVLGAQMSVGPVKGRSSKYLLDATSRFDRFVRGGAFVSNDNAARIQTRVMREVARVWPKTNASKQRIIDALVQGDVDQRTYGFNEVKRQFGLTDREATAYAAYRRGMDMMWSLQNRDLRRTMVERGVKSIETPGLDRVYGIPFDNDGDALRAMREIVPEDAREIEVLDSITGKPVTKTMDEIRAAYDGETGQLVRLFSPRMTEDGKFDFAWVDTASIGSDVRIGAVDTFPMPYREGHVPRFYEGEFFIDRVLKNGRRNGHPLKEGDPGLVNTIGASVTKRSAERLAADLTAEAEAKGETNYRYVVRRDRTRASSPEERALRDWKVMQARGLTTQRRRGERLITERPSPEADYPVAKIDDPFSAFVRNVRATSRHIAHRDALETMRARFLAQHGPVLNGEIVTDPDTIAEIARANGASTARIKQIQDEASYLESLSRSPINVDQRFSDAMFDLAESVESFRKFPLAEGTSTALRAAGDARPVQMIRSVPFIAFLALNPARQILVQSGQLAQLQGVIPQYMWTGGMARDMTAFNYARLARSMTSDKKLGDRSFNIMAVTMGRDVDEVRRMFSAFFERSGFPFNIDQHLLVSGLSDPFLTGKVLSKNHFVRQAQRLRRGGANIVRAAKTVGFDEGEFQNVLGTWLGARERWLQQNPGKADSWDSKSNLDEINTLAREMSLSMTEPGRFHQQDGVWSLVYQFWSIPHKSLLNITTSQLWTPAEKAKIAGFSVAMFGAAGITGADWILDQTEDELGFELPPRVRQMLHGGWLDLGINVGADAMMNNKEPSNMLISENFSPYAQTVENITKIWENTDRTVFEYVNSVVPAGAAGSRILRAWRAMGALAAKEEPLRRKFDPEVVNTQMRIAFDVASGMSNYTKMRVGLESGMAVSATGSRTVGINRAEAMAKFFGVSTQDEKDFYDAIGDNYDRVKDIRADVEIIYKGLKQAQLQDDQTELEKYEDRWAAMKSVWSEDDQLLAWEWMQRLSRRDRETGEQSLFEMYLRRAGRSGGMVSTQELIDEVTGAAEALPRERQDALRNLLERQLRAQKEAKRTLEESGE